MNKLTVLKLGGSVITYKKQGGRIRRKTVEKIAMEIKRSFGKSYNRLILVHGAGGMAHRQAVSLGLKDGVQSRKNIFRTLEIHKTVSDLLIKISEIFWRKNVMVFPIQTSACFCYKNSRLIFYNHQLINELMEHGLIPLLHGDMIFDNLKNFCILSGDRIVIKCAEKFKASRILFATDVDGVYVSNPNKNKKTKMLHTVNLKQSKNLTKQRDVINKSDATGGMIGKLKNLMKIKLSIPIIIFNGLKISNWKPALTGKTVGTLLRVK